MKCVMCTMALLPVPRVIMIVWKIYFLVTFFHEEDDSDQEDDTYSLENDASDKDSCMSDKFVDEDYLAFMENPIYDMSEEENNEP